MAVEEGGLAYGAGDRAAAGGGDFFEEGGAFGAVGAVEAQFDEFEGVELAFELGAKLGREAGFAEVEGGLERLAVAAQGGALGTGKRRSFHSWWGGAWRGAEGLHSGKTRGRREKLQGTARLADVGGMQLTKHWAVALDDYVIDLAWSPDGTRLAAASAAGPVTLCATADGAAPAPLPGHEDGTNALAWHPTQDLLATGGQDGAVKFWDAGSAQHVATAALGAAWVEHLAWRPAGAGATLAAAAGRQLTFLRADGAVAFRCPATAKTISALAWQPAGGCLAASHFGGVELWDGDDFLLQKTLPYANGIHALVWSPDNRWLVSGNADPSVHLWRPADDDEFQMSGYETKVKALAFDGDSRWLATSGGQDACLWDCTGAGPEGREPLMLPHDARVCAVAFQRGHGVLATASEDGVVQLWSPARAQPLRATVRLPAAATKLAWSPDDALLAVGSTQGVVYVLRCVP